MSGTFGIIITYRVILIGIYSMTLTECSSLFELIVVLGAGIDALALASASSGNPVPAQGVAVVPGADQAEAMC